MAASTFHFMSQSSPRKCCECSRYGVTARVQSLLGTQHSRGVAKLGWNVGAVQAGRRPLRSRPVRAVWGCPGYWWAGVRGGEGEETLAAFKHGRGGLRANNNDVALFSRFTSTPCGPGAVCSGPCSAVA